MLKMPSLNSYKIPGWGEGEKVGRGLEMFTEVYAEVIEAVQLCDNCLTL